MEWLINIADLLVTISLFDSSGVIHRASHATWSHSIGHENDHTQHALEIADHEVTSKFLVRAVVYVGMSLSYGGAPEDNDDVSNASLRQESFAGWFHHAAVIT